MALTYSFNYSSRVPAGSWIIDYLKRVGTPKTASEISVATGKWRTQTTQAAKLLVQRGILGRTPDKKYYLMESK